MGLTKHILCWLFGVFAFANLAQAEWFQGEAKANINGNPLEDVRLTALKNAVADAAFKGGSMITAEEVMLNGLLVSSKAEIRTAGRIQRVEILSETLENDVLHVVVSVNMTPTVNCVSDKYARSILIGQFELQSPRQAAYGGLYDLGEQISKRFERQLAAQESSPSVKLMDKSFASAKQIDQLSTAELNARATYLAKTYGKQFILFGFVRDISLFEQVKEELLGEDVSVRRNFTVNVFLMDAFSQTVLMKDSYHGEADWDFAPNYRVDTNNSLFWRSDFGRMVLNTINAAVTDTMSELMCEKTLTQVIDKLNDELLIGMGSADGVEMHDEFVLLKSRFLAGGFATGLSVMQTASDYSYYVTHVNQHSAVLKIHNMSAGSPGELFDLMSPVGKHGAAPELELPALPVNVGKSANGR